MKAASIIGWAVGVLTLAAAAVYFFRYLYYWEWHRALITGIIFVAAEVAVATGMVLRKLSRAERERDTGAAAKPDPAVLARIQQTRPERDHFAWLDPRNGTMNVFITVLLGGGAIVSGLAWAVEKVAGSTATPSRERNLATRLETIGFPSGGLVPQEGELLAQQGPYGEDDGLRLLLGPAGNRRRDGDRR